MTTLVLDEEAGMRSQCVMDWAAASGINLIFRASRQKVWLAERHGDIFRSSLQTAEAQLVTEGLAVPFEQVLSSCVFMHNSLTVINNTTPYQALLGRQPAMLPPFEGGHSGEVDSQARSETNTRHHARVREVTAMSYIEATARARLLRIEKHKARPAAERLDTQAFVPGALCDIWFEPLNKDQSGWRGPAKLLSCNATQGDVHVRIQGRTLQRKVGEVREHIPYLVFAGVVGSSYSRHLLALQHYCQGLSFQHIRILGVVHSHKGWTTTKLSCVQPGKSVVQSALIVSSSILHINSCVTIRMWRGCPKVCPLDGHNESEIIVWAEGFEDVVQHFESNPGDLDRPVPTKELTQFYMSDLGVKLTAECVMQQEM